MKANELMIGDWVEFIQSDGQGFYAQVEALNDDGTFAESGFFADNMVKPIPLTEELLEKNGFKYKEFPEFAVNEITEKTKITITYHSGTKTIFIGISKPNFNLTSSHVLYVHEMQNLLRDARIDKEITI